MDEVSSNHEPLIITHENRFVYAFIESDLIIIQCRYHYD